MQELLIEMRRAMANEYKRMAEVHGADFHSTHEAWAITKEEVDEAMDDLHDMLECLMEAWNYTIADESPAAAYKKLEKVALSTAAECVQVAACSYKALRSECCVEAK